jgi:hypothetical protein
VNQPVGSIRTYVVTGSGGGWWPDEGDVGVVDKPDGPVLLMRCLPGGFPVRTAVDFGHSPSS